ncbi:MAG: hypothetical protein M3Q58_09055 [Bacteroidota bacterium]|nr:hypothetical protein [Bacteroidota bacterium]
MTIIEILIILFLALFVTAIFYYIFKSKGQGSILFFFLIIFFASWAARFWIVPVGPVFLGLSWIPILIVGAIFAFILSGAYSSSTYKSKNQNKENIETTDEDKASITISGYIWVLL